MSDLAAPLLYVMRDEAEAFWAFAALMDRCEANFHTDCTCARVFKHGTPHMHLRCIHALTLHALETARRSRTGRFLRRATRLHGNAET